MKQKQFTHAITFFTTGANYHLVKDIADTKRIAISELLRDMVDKFLEVTIVEDLSHHKTMMANKELD
jgi:hypothetical protein